MSFHIVFVAVGLFALTFLSPGPNLLVVVQTSLAHGRTGGMMAGLGVAAGDAIYAGLGLLGMATLIADGGVLFSLVKIGGGAYLFWYGMRALLARRAAPQDIASHADTFPASASRGALFRRGLLTDLANPQTVLFFASIFSVTLKPDTDWRVRLATWAGIVLTSAIWRVVVSSAFSRPALRRGYARAGQTLERVVGVALAGFGLRLIHQGIHRQ
ncbi:homoserine/threonine efflux transporter [Chitinasiproducens palmae]|uniref:Amino acid exporter n=1 Tax=Chitinasiproducens palmae TaxID=1770053 RepID=A0A1H2PJA8_9BURK|nr:homoserine/threonine efflux transporter [Chitinasiproducens palmae]SDV46456.1 amino acid exporter [Chitinasiproducens palmae]